MARVSRKNKELFKLMDDLHDNKEQLDYYAIKRNRSGSRMSNRLDCIEKHALEIEIIANKIQQQVRGMRRN